jgi:hypothetical protein
MASPAHHRMLCRGFTSVGLSDSPTPELNESVKYLLAHRLHTVPSRGINGFSDRDDRDRDF